LQGNNLVVAGASGNLDPLLELARTKIDLAAVTRNLAMR